MSETRRKNFNSSGILLSKIRNRMGMLQRASLEQAWLTAEQIEPVGPFERTNELEDRPPDQELEALLSKLHSCLPDVPIDSETCREFKSGDWSIGSEYRAWKKPRKILRGYIVPVRNVPIRASVSLRVFAFITINDGTLLEAHSHHGIHYHYCLADKQHTTTILCWDTRWTSVSSSPREVRAIFHELHGEGAKSLQARPDRWKEEKRKSIWDKCAPDLKRSEIGNFRCASNDSSPVWPATAKLTPHPSSLKPKIRRKYR